ncbi:hypothetical protein [Anaeroselena agilis]|uniref:Uncharacterized protein n=1 Tax=Anaeroselena agilis TaxID=3063788 RepID=A0ABU3P5Z4_9FIRM|nr:hypothetical protein [Selenomonadales bacterium 4137-cl]
MYNYTVTRIACGAVFRLAFAAGTCVGGACGIILGLLESSAVGVLGGAFLGLTVGVATGVVALASAAVFNLLAPYLGGVAVRLEPVPAAPPAADAQPEQPEQPAGD